MNISFVPSQDLKQAADFTYQNMRIYYEQFAPEWDVEKIQDVTAKLNNFDIIHNEKVVGVMRLEFDSNSCILRDLQVTSALQNNGIGRLALTEAKKRAQKKKVSTLSLRVLKISPAVRLYQRFSFVTKREDERFFYMELEL